MYFADVENIMDDGVRVDIIYLDCRKVFDMVPHGHSLAKVEVAGTGGEVKQWIKSFFLKP